MVKIRIKKVGSFKIRVGERKPRRIKDYKDRKKPYKTKSGAIWNEEGEYFKRGQKGRKHGKKIGWVSYD